MSTEAQSMEDAPEVQFTRSTTNLAVASPKAEPKAEDDEDYVESKPVLPSSPPADTASPMALWREVLQSQPEWPHLPDNIQAAVELRLKSTNFPAEPSGHTAWKNAKAALRNLKKPKDVDLITATYIWRAKQKRKSPNMLVNALPDSLVTDATFAQPPIDLRSWPRRDGAVLQWVGEAMVKDEVGDDGHEGEADATPEAATASTSRPATATPSPSTGSAVVDGTTKGKKKRAADSETPTPRPAKVAKTDSSATTQTAAFTAASEPKVKGWSVWFAKADKHLATLKAKITTQASDLADAKTELSEAKEALEEKVATLSAELDEVKSIAISNRKNIRKLVGFVSEATKAPLSSLGKLSKELKKMEENMG